MFQSAMLGFEGGDPTNHHDGIEHDQNFRLIIIGMATMRTIFLPLLKTFVQSKVDFDIVDL
jgi:hypothetical protein